MSQDKPQKHASQPEASPPQPGKKQAWLAELYGLYWRDLCNFVASRYGAGPPEPEDIVQTAYLKVAALDHPEAVHNPRAFLFRTVRNLAIDALRGAKHATAYQDDLAARQDEINYDSLTPEIVFLSMEEMNLVAEAIKRLPKQARRCLLLHRLEGLSYSEIARREKLSRPRVQKLIDKALAACLRAAQRQTSVK